jgi:DHA2 family multidrug resistance protein-like MFS transporter
MTLFSNLPGDEGLSGHERARVMAAVMTTTLMGVFDGTMINIALPSMASACRFLPMLRSGSPTVICCQRQ